MKVLLAGPTAHEFVLPPCPDCPEGEAGCTVRTTRPSLDLRLRPGAYDVFVRVTARSGPDPSLTRNEYATGFGYSPCYFVEPSR